MVKGMPQAKKLKMLREQWAEQQAKMHAEVSQWFELFDENGDGQLQRHELRALLTHLNPQRAPSEANLDWLVEKATAIETHTMIIHGNRHGAVGFHELRETVMRYSDYCKDEAYLDAIFKEFDDDGNEELDEDELLGLLQKVAPEGCEADAADVQFVMETCDLDGNGVITRDEVLPMISRWSQIAQAKASKEPDARGWDVLKPLARQVPDVTPIAARILTVVAVAKAKEQKEESLRSRWQKASTGVQLQSGSRGGLLTRAVAAAKADEAAAAALQRARESEQRESVALTREADALAHAAGECTPVWSEFVFAGPPGERRLVPAAGSSMDELARQRRGSLDHALPGLDAAIHDATFQASRRPTIDSTTSDSTEADATSSRERGVPARSMMCAVL